jgi:hypothetical protein
VENLLQKPDTQSTTNDGNRIRDDCFTEMLYSVRQASCSEAWLAAATPCVFCDPGSLFWVSIFVASFFTCLLLSASESHPTADRTGEQGTRRDEDEDEETREARKSLTPFRLSYTTWGTTVPSACRIWHGLGGVFFLGGLLTKLKTFSFVGRRNRFQQGAFSATRQSSHTQKNS